MDTNTALVLIALLAVLAYCSPVLLAFIPSKRKVTYSVWVGGGEVNSHEITSKKVAEDIARCWREKGYDDVIVETIYHRE